MIQITQRFSEVTEENLRIKQEISKLKEKILKTLRNSRGREMGISIS